MKKSAVFILFLAILTVLSSCGEIKKEPDIPARVDVPGQQESATEELPEELPEDKPAEPYTWNREEFLSTYSDEKMEDEAGKVIASVFDSVSKKPTFLSQFPRMCDYPEEYEQLKSLGTDYLPYYLKYVFSDKAPGFYNAFLYSACFQMARDNEMIEIAGSGSPKYDCEYGYGTPEYYSVQLLYRMNQ